MKKASRGSCWPGIAYVTGYAAMRIIAYIRNIQGAIYVKGKDFHEIRARIAIQDRAWKRRRRELNAQAAIGLANPVAETEAKRQRSACAKAESPKPRRCV